MNTELNIGLHLSSENAQIMERFCDAVDFLKAASQSGAEVKLQWPEAAPTSPAPAPVAAAAAAAPAPVVPVSGNPIPAASPSALIPGCMTGAQPQPAVTTTAPAPVIPQTAAPQYSLDDIARAGAQLAAQGPDKITALTALLQQFGLQSVNQLRAEQTGAFVMALRGLGARI